MKTQEFFTQVGTIHLNVRRSHRSSYPFAKETVHDSTEPEFQTITSPAAVMRTCQKLLDQWHLVQLYVDVKFSSNFKESKILELCSFVGYSITSTGRPSNVRLRQRASICPFGSSIAAKRRVPVRCICIKMPSCLSLASSSESDASSLLASSLLLSSKESSDSVVSLSIDSSTCWQAKVSICLSLYSCVAPSLNSHNSLPLFFLFNNSAIKISGDTDFLMNWNLTSPTGMALSAVNLSTSLL
mmetsp:Transcript_10352/g.17588  ORF Transcript_10352/g.17588 Transcript_10352/m.17588 type:complete len:242 (+) Transcript_10352:766-1491(+)